MTDEPAPIRLLRAQADAAQKRAAGYAEELPSARKNAELTIARIAANRDENLAIAAAMRDAIAALEAHYAKAGDKP
jgi:hypothetical protein